MLTISEIRVVNLLLYPFAPSRQGDEGEEGGNHHHGVDMGVAVENETTKVEGEHASDESPSQTEVFKSEEYPNDGHGEEGEDDGRHCANLFHHFAKEKLVEADEEAVQRAPDDKIPRSAVPQSREKEAEP